MKASAKAPAGLVGAALLLWGVSIGLPWLGAAAGIGFEALRWAAPAPSARAASRLATVVRVCALIALASLAGWVSTQGLPQALYSWLRWLPLVLLPLPAMQLLVHRLTPQRLQRALRPGMPPLAQAAPPEDDREIDLTHLHAALTLAAAGTGTGAQAWLYPGFVIIVGWALLARQAHQASQPVGHRARAAALVLVASGLGYAVHTGIAALQGQVEEWSTDLIADWLAAPPDAFRERTRIGDLGKIKLSDRIVMRVATEGPRPEALLLRESIFDRYRGGEWQTVRRAARPAARVEGAPGEHGETTHWLLSDGPATARLSVRRSLPGGEGLLPLPLGARSVGALPALAVDVLPSGTVRAHGMPRFIAMNVAYDEAAEVGAPEPAVDLEVPAPLGSTLARVIEEERLAQPTAAATVAAVRGFFAAKFAYSLELGEARPGAGSQGGRTLADFLLRDRKGHCEYFATATVLLLRQAGIPARYVGGFSVQEYSPREQAFVVRARHAHAWAQAWVDGRWVFVDTTPSSWAAFEGEAARSEFGPLLDAVSWLVDQGLQAWLTLVDRASGLPLWTLAAAVLGAALAVLSIALALRVAARRLCSRRRRAGLDPPDAIAMAWAQVEASVAQAGHVRANDETVRAWVRRLNQASDTAGYPTTQRQPWRASLLELGDAYYRVRFDPAAPAGERRDFVNAAQGWTMPRHPAPVPRAAPSAP